MSETPESPAVETLATLLAEHRYVYGQQIGRLCACGEPDPYGQRRGNGAAAHRRHVATVLAAHTQQAVDAALGEERGRTLAPLEALAADWMEGCATGHPDCAHDEDCVGCAAEELLRVVREARARNGGEKDAAGEVRRLSPVHPLEATWTPGERVEAVSKPFGPYGPVVTRPGTVARIDRTYGYHEHLIVAFDDGEERGINPDVMRHIRARGGEDRG